MNQTDEGTENLWRMVADDLSQMFRGDPAQEPVSFPIKVASPDFIWYYGEVRQRSKFY